MERVGLVFSPQYAYVRGRQLEGTFPGDRWTGIWVVTVMRIGHGWGSLPEQFWPYDTSAWPPVEPAGLDVIARKYRPNTYYKRVRTVNDCKITLQQMPVVVAVSINEDWYNAPQGRIPPLQKSYVPTGNHSVLLVGYDDRRIEFIFQNSWGANWGDSGCGYLPYDVLRETCIESWAELLGGEKDWGQPISGVAFRTWGLRDFTGEIVHGCEIIGSNENRLAWAYAVERQGALEVEELFVMPEFRRRKYGQALADSMRKVATGKGARLKFWISHADTSPENLAVVERLLRPLGLHIESSSERWASYFFTSTSE